MKLSGGLFIEFKPYTHSTLQAVCNIYVFSPLVDIVMFYWDKLKTKQTIILPQTKELAHE